MLDEGGLLMRIVPIPAFLDNYIWAIVDDELCVFDCVDPGDAVPVCHFARTQQLDLRAVLLTHHHLDHIGGVSKLLEAFPHRVVYGPHDARMGCVTHPVGGNQILALGVYSFHILNTPGHTATHISYYEPEKGWLFCGDTLFSAGCGRVFDGTMEQLHHSVGMFKQLPPHTKVYCAHEYTRQNLQFAKTVEPTNQAVLSYLEKQNELKSFCSLPSTVALERSINPFLRTDIPEVIRFATQHGAVSLESLEVFEMLRHQKDVF